MAKPRRKCDWTSMIDGVPCGNDALSRKDYCHLHDSIQDAADNFGFDNRVLFGLMAEAFARIFRPGSGFAPGFDPFGPGFDPIPPKPVRVKNYYKILGEGLSPSSDAAELKSAYRKAALAAHPDRGGAAERMALINEAWATLGDPTKRRGYDRVWKAAVRAARSRPKEGKT